MNKILMSATFFCLLSLLMVLDVFAGEKDITIGTPYLIETDDGPRLAAAIYDASSKADCVPPPGSDPILLNPEGLPYTHFKEYISDTPLQDMIAEIEAITGADPNAIVLVTVRDDDDSVKDEINIEEHSIPGRSTFALANRTLKIRYENDGLDDTTFGEATYLVPGIYPRQNYMGPTYRSVWRSVALHLEPRAHINGWDLDGRWNGHQGQDINRDAILFGIYVASNGKHFISNTSIKNFSGYGFVIAEKATAYADEIAVHNNSQNVWVDAMGYFDESNRSNSYSRGGTLYISNSSIMDSNSHGLYVANQGKVYADYLNISNNGAWGAGTQSKGYLEISNSYIRGNTPDWGVYGLITFGGEVKASNVNVRAEETSGTKGILKIDDVVWTSSWEPASAD